MLNLTVKIVHHDLYRAVPCCLCGAEWEEQWVGVTLMVQDQALGDLCPRCLSQKPQRGAQRFHELHSKLDDLYFRTREHLLRAQLKGPLPITAEELTDQAARVRESTEQLRTLAQQRRAVSAELFGITRQTQTQLLKLQADLQRLMNGAKPADAQGVEVLEQSLLRLESWPIKLGQVLQAERTCFLQQFGGMEELFVRRAVDDRYHHFLTTPV